MVAQNSNLYIGKCIHRVCIVGRVVEVGLKDLVTSNPVSIATMMGSRAADEII